MELSWKYSKGQTPPAPIIEINLGGFSIELVVDTGFGGGILIPFPLFQSLGLLNALSLDSYHVVMPDSRRTLLYTAKTDVIIGKKSVPAEVHASPTIEKRLLGRSLLRSFVTVLDGRKQELRISDFL